jgi:hypothetical protein
MAGESSRRRDPSGSPRRRLAGWRFFLTNAIVWLVMTALLVVVPNALEPRLSMPVARVLGWAVACSVWVVTVEAGWQRRYGPVPRFLVQLVLWVAAALVAMWISDQFRVG